VTSQNNEYHSAQNPILILRLPLHNVIKTCGLLWVRQGLLGTFCRDIILWSPLWLQKTICISFLAFLFISLFLPSFLPFFLYLILSFILSLFLSFSLCLFVCLFVCFFLSFFLSFFLPPARLYDSSHHKQLYVLLRECFWWQNNNLGIVSTFTRFDPVWVLHVGHVEIV